jgi:amidase
VEDVQGIKRWRANTVSTTTSSSGQDHDLLYADVRTNAARILDKSISAVELTHAYLQRIEAINPIINAVVALSDDALRQAEEADAALARGETHGPLHGIPMTIKDCFDTAGAVSTWGTKGRANYVPPTDATIVSRLKAAGAILLGKTNTPEFTLNFETHNDLHGFTHNPYNTDHSPGGSSGGAAALIAAGGTAFDIGTDYGGSIRLPAHCCGITGIKPTSGSVPRTGLCLPPGGLTDHLSHVGPLARSVGDLTALLSIIWGPDNIDSHIAPVPFPDPSTINVADLNCVLMLDNGIVTPDDQTRLLVQAAADHLAAIGADIIPGVIPTSELSDEVMSAAWAVGMARMVEQAQNQAGTLTEEFSIGWVKAASAAANHQVDPLAIADYLDKTEQVRRESLAFMAPFDLLICPVNPAPAQTHPEPGGSPFPGGWGSYTSLFDVTGFPAGVVRAGTSDDGLPIGVQIVGKPWREDTVLSAMASLEEAFGRFERPQL